MLPPSSPVTHCTDNINTDTRTKKPLISAPSSSHRSQRSLGLPSTLIHHENAHETGGISKHQLLDFVWTENILKTAFLENDDVAIIMCFL